ncbi:MAG: hypothetical protein GY797_23415, partial [Deltaproteobacteria bacterium]|nr:hypothetical protein [Deltaproteobacteria bacterium]
MNKLKERIRSYYDRVVKVRGPEEEIENHALWHQAKTGKKGNHLHQFKGRCNKCGKYGHKAKECRPGGIEKSVENPRVCHFCGKPGHIMKYCYKLKATKENNTRGNVDTKNEIALIASDKNKDDQSEIWYADSGANSHMTYSQIGMYNLTKLCKTIIVGNGEELECNLKGDLKLRTIDGDEKKLTIMLSNVLYVPRLKANLCSLSKITEIAGTKVNLTADGVVVKKEREDSIKLFSRE